MPIDTLNDSYVLEGRVVTMGSQGVINEGAIYIRSGQIEAVMAEDAPPPAAFTDATRIKTGGTIYPGLIELHNHLSYNALPLWNVPRKYLHSGHWQGKDEYKVAVTKPAMVLANTAGNAEALVRFVECRCLLGGVTSSQGITLQANAGVRRLYKGLVRNVEAPTVDGLQAAKARIGAPDKDLDAYLRKLKDAPKCYLQHLSEGINDGRYNTALKQFTNLQRDDGSWALFDSFCGIHSTALETEHFEVMAQHEGSIVWSPLSNYLLYGETTDVKAAKAAGVPIALGCDWAPSGSKNLLGELKVADIVSDELGGLFSARELCEMVTTTPAAILGWDDRLGRIEKGKLADLVVVDDFTDDPYEKLVSARETSLTLVVINGIPRVGQTRLMGKFITGGEKVRVGRSTRILDLTTEIADADLGGLTLWGARQRLADTLENLPDRAQDLDDAVAAGWVPGVSVAASGVDTALLPSSWEEPPLRVVLEFEEEDSEDAFLEALQAGDLADWVEPMELEGLTVAEDRDILKRLLRARNLPHFIKEKLPALHGVELVVPESAQFLTDGAADLAPELIAPGELREFLDVQRMLDLEDRQRTIEQVILLLNRYYVHLPMKKTMHAVDPVQRLRILSHELEQGSGEPMLDLDFYREVIAACDSLRDLHTAYRLPRPFRGKVAWLPYLIEECFDRETKQRRYLISKLIANPGPDSFEAGVEVLSWNGVPIDRFVKRIAAQMPSGNPAACWARAMNSLTVRSITRGQIPDEDFVRLQYRTRDGRTAHYEQAWLLFEPSAGSRNLSPENFGRVEAAGLGLDDHTDDLQQAKKALFASDRIAQEEQISMGAGLAAVTAGADSDTDEEATTLPTIFQARRVYSEDNNAFGYLRIFSFNIDNADEFVDELRRLLGCLPQDGLIIDVRGNGGGLIHAAERALGLLSPRAVEPEPAQFINTPATLRLCRRHSVSQRLQGLVLAPWLDSMERSVASGATHSLGFPITPPEDCKRTGQQYQGPKVLIVDGLCYSAADMFIAGFKDHNLGWIIGLHNSTGAGGANVWSHRLLRYLAVDQPGHGGLRRLPGGADLRIAVRRTLRVGPNAGEVIEDFGIAPDQIHLMTENDIRGKNEDLIATAVEALQSLPYYRLSVTRDHEAVEVEAPGADWVQVTRAERPLGSFDLGSTGRTRLAGQRLGAAGQEVEFAAFAEGQPVASTRYIL